MRCTSCGPGHRLVDEMCTKGFSWSPWSSWSICSATCGTSGKRHRQRVCGDPGRCRGESREESPCLNTLPACVGTWSDWGPWSACSKTCGLEGRRSRQRTCDGNRCPGVSRQEFGCNIGKDCGCTQGTGAMITRDFHGNDPENNRFDARCDGGCFQIYKIVHDCKERDPRQDEIDIVKRICEGKSVCQFTPAPSLFGPRGCNGNKVTWVTFACNGGSLVQNHKDGKKPEGGGGRKKGGWSIGGWSFILG